MVEYWIENPCVSGSNPFLDGTISIMRQDTINSLIKIKNSSLNFQKNFTSIPFNALTFSLVKILYKKGVIQGFCVHNGIYRKVIQIRFNPMKHNSCLNNMTIISSPSKNVYLRYSELCRIISNDKVLVFSTDKGILTLDECKKLRLGGQLLLLL